MKLLRPVSKWLFRKPSKSRRALEGLQFTQADIDLELFHPAPMQPAPAVSAVRVTWLDEEARA